MVDQFRNILSMNDSCECSHKKHETNYHNIRCFGPAPVLGYMSHCYQSQLGVLLNSRFFFIITEPSLLTVITVRNMRLMSILLCAS